MRVRKLNRTRREPSQRTLLNDAVQSTTNLPMFNKPFSGKVIERALTSATADSESLVSGVVKAYLR